jgi:glycosyltransferase involved in cell wall biosynthesis
MSADHIAIILHDFSTGGSERIAIRLANAWVAQGRRVSLFCGTEQGAARALVGPGVRVEACVPETVRSPWSRLQLGWRIASLVRRSQPDIVFSPGNFHLIILAVLARMHFAKRPVMVSKLSNPIRRSGIRAVLKSLADAAIRTIAAPVDALTAMSPALGDEARAVFRALPVIEINEPILSDEIIKDATVWTQSDQPLILCIGRLCHQKDFATAIRAFALLPLALNARMMILGEGPLRRKLTALAQQLGVTDRIEMPGYVSSVDPFLPKADLLLMTSRYEGYPAVLIEAIAAGLPIVTTRCSLAIAEILPTSNLGTIVDSLDPATIAGAVEAQLQRPPPSPEIRAQQTDAFRIGPSSRAYLAAFDGLLA